MFDIGKIWRKSSSDVSRQKLTRALLRIADDPRKGMEVLRGDPVIGKLFQAEIDAAGKRLGALVIQRHAGELGVMHENMEGLSKAMPGLRAEIAAGLQRDEVDMVARHPQAWPIAASALTKFLNDPRVAARLIELSPEPHPVVVAAKKIWSRFTSNFG